MQVEQDFASVITLQDEHVVSVHRYVELPSFPYIPSATVVTGTDLEMLESVGLDKNTVSGRLLLQSSIAD